MKPTPNLAVERYRVREGEHGTNRSYGNNGAFDVPYQPWNPQQVWLRCIVSDGLGWDHVSVTVATRRLSPRTPTYEEMDFIKRLFWSDDETVVQFHVKRAVHVNVHNHCLHLWRPQDADIPLPLPEMV